MSKSFPWALKPPSKCEDKASSRLRVSSSSQSFAFKGLGGPLENVIKTSDVLNDVRCD